MAKKLLIGLLCTILVILVILIIRLSLKEHGVDTSTTQHENYKNSAVTSELNPSGVDSPTVGTDQDLLCTYSTDEVAACLEDLQVSTEEKTITFKDGSAYIEKGINHYTAPFTVTKGDGSYSVHVDDETLSITEVGTELIVECGDESYRVEVK